MKKTEYFVNYKIDEEQIIDLDTLLQAEKGNNNYNPDDFIFICEATSLEEAEQKYRRDIMLCEMEKMYHP